MSKGAKLFTFEEVFKHNKEGDIWVIYENHVLDVSKFTTHPGGPEVLWELAGTPKKRVKLTVTGRDITQSFEDIGHSTDAVKLVDDYKIGTIDPNSPKFNYPASVAGAGANSQSLSSLALPILIIVLAILGYFFL